MPLAGAAAVTGCNRLVMTAYLYARCLTIAGRAWEIARNAELHSRAVA